MSLLTDAEIFDIVQPHLPQNGYQKGHARIWDTSPKYAQEVGFDMDARWIITEMHPEHTVAACRAIEAATAAKYAERIAELQAKLDAAAVDAERWLPIESAPKDGTEVLVYVRGDSLYPTAAAFRSAEYFDKEYGDRDYMEEGWYWAFGYPSDFHECVIEPTHWMPLPPEPDIDAMRTEMKNQNR